MRGVISRILLVFIAAALVFSLFPRVSCKYAEEEHVYVEDLGNVWHFHNYFDDFYVDKGGLQISNNLSQSWAYVVAGVSFTFRGRSYSFWTDKLPLEWTAFNGSNYAVLNGTILLISGIFGTLQFTLNYHLIWNSSYIQITPVLIADLKYPVENVILHYRMENVSIDGNIADDFCAFLFNNETYEYFLPAYFEHSTVNITESLNHLFIYDNVTWKFVDYVWEWNYTLNQMQIPVNVTLIGDGANVQADFNYGNFPLQFIFRHSFWWHDPVETRYMRSDQHTINGLTAYKLGTTQTSSGIYQEISESGQYNCRWRALVYVRHADGSEDQVGYTAFIYRDTDGEGIQSVTLSVPLTGLSSTDAIRVRVYMAIYSVRTYIDFITEQLGASQLDEATWTFYLYTYRDVTGNPLIGYTTHARFYWGDSTHNSRIEGFSYSTAPVKEWHDISLWNFTVQTRQWNTVSAWSFTVLTRTWQSIATWNFNLTAMAWHNISIWTFNLITKTWNVIAEWTWNLVTHGWHTISYWTITLTTETQKKLPFIILIGGIFTVLIAIFIVYKR